MYKNVEDRAFYSITTEMAANLKMKIEAIVVAFVKSNIMHLILICCFMMLQHYTLKLLKKMNLEKMVFQDNKSQQPQILVALMVTKEGFPISYEIFAGNTFEGHTILPVVKSFIRKNRVNHLQ
ncbi:MAG: hypothetical protein IPH61_14455 [Bacteroidetes bacterium]|nr:hypothetical protein [Bacteroidota bacterium]